MSDVKKIKSNDEVMKKTVFQLSVPIFFSAFLSIMLGNVDTIMLSNYSETAVGAIGNANTIIGFLSLAFSVISSATGIVVSQYLGAEKKEEMNRIYTVAVGFNLILSGAISLVVFLFSEPLLLAMQVPPEMIPDATAYMQIVGGTIFTQALLNALTQIFASNGKTTFTVIISTGMNIINIAGNWLFLYGPLQIFGLGASGVAVSTCISRIIAVAAAFIYLYTVLNGRIGIRYLIPFPGKILKQLLGLGIPTAGENISYNFSQLVIAALINTMGIAAINAKIYANMLSMFNYMLAFSAATGTQILVGHSIGAGDDSFAYNRVMKTLRITLPISISVATLNWIIAPLTFSIFSKDPNVISLGQTVMLVSVLLELGRTTNIVIINSMKAAGDVKFPTILAIFSMWGISVLFAYVLGVLLGMGLLGVWIGMAADEILRGIIVYIRWKKGSWKGKGVIIKDE